MDRIADYQLVRSLGQGNHGEFFLAVTPARLSLDVDHVAVKVLEAPTDEDGFRRATRELRVFAAARSPFLARLFDAGQDGHRFFYAMEYFPLGSLERPARPLDRFETLRAVAHAARAAHDLHEVGVAHRAIKPANILLHDDGAKLSDLGLAQLQAPGQTVTGVGSIGAVEYMDPAVLRGERAARSSDIWSLGATLHRVLAGVGVYGELPTGNPLLTVQRVLSTTPSVSAGLSTAEASLVSSCLDPDPLARPSTAGVVADRIEQLAGEIVEG